MTRNIFGRDRSLSSTIKNGFACVLSDDLVIIVTL